MQWGFADSLYYRTKGITNVNFEPTLDCLQTSRQKTFDRKLLTYLHCRLHKNNVHNTDKKIMLADYRFNVFNAWWSVRLRLTAKRTPKAFAHIFRRRGAAFTRFHGISTLNSVEFVFPKIWLDYTVANFITNQWRIKKDRNFSSKNSS